MIKQKRQIDKLRVLRHGIPAAALSGGGWIFQVNQYPQFLRPPLNSPESLSCLTAERFYNVSEEVLMVVGCSSRLHRKEIPLGLHSKKVIIVLTGKDHQSLCCGVQSGGSWVSPTLTNANPSGWHRAGIRSAGAEYRKPREDRKQRRGKSEKLIRPFSEQHTQCLIFWNSDKLSQKFLIITVCLSWNIIYM